MATGDTDNCYDHYRDCVSYCTITLSAISVLESYYHETPKPLMTKEQAERFRWLRGK